MPPLVFGPFHYDCPGNARNLSVLTGRPGRRWVVLSPAVGKPGGADAHSRSVPAPKSARPGLPAVLRCHPGLGGKRGYYDAGHRKEGRVSGLTPRSIGVVCLAVLICTSLVHSRVSAAPGDSVT